MSWFSKAVRKVKKEVKRTGRKIEKETKRAVDNPLVRAAATVYAPGSSTFFGAVDAYNNYRSGGTPSVSSGQQGGRSSSVIAPTDGLNASELRNLSDFREFNARKAAEKDQHFRSFNRRVDQVAKVKPSFATKLRGENEAINNFADQETSLYSGDFDHSKENQSAAASIRLDEK
jgi:hypothetical protein